MNSAPWPQEIVVKPMEPKTTNSSDTSNSKVPSKPQPSTSLERKVRPQKDQALNCPRCNSTNTKFCYYNNYSLTQPRYFCKACRRYWTEGGTLRNIPVGGGSRKNKRPASSAFPSSNTTSKIKLPDLVTTCTNPNSKIHHEQGQDLHLGFPASLSEFMQLPSMNHSTPNTSNTSHLSALELLTGLTSNSRGLSLMTPFMGMQIPHDPNSVFPSRFSLHSDLKSGISFTQSDGLNNGGRILFPFEHLKSNITPATTATAAGDEHHQNHSSDQQIVRDQQGDSTGYWTGILGGAGSW